MSQSKKPKAMMPPPPLIDGYEDDTNKFEESDANDTRVWRSSHPSGDGQRTSLLSGQGQLTNKPSIHSTWSVVREDLVSGKNLEQRLADTAVHQPTAFPSISGYEIIRLLGRGGMGVVYLAREEKLDRLVAIKMLNESADHLRERFLSETKAVATLQHHNIAQLFASDEVNGRPYYVMEFVEGQTLEQQLGTKPQNSKTAAEIVITLAKAMAYTHHRGLLHRDLKPSNVLVGNDGTLKIADFGLAKSYLSDSTSTQTGEILGTPSYMAPEQASGVTKKLNEACDIYSLGGILYRLLTGTAPFNAADPMQTVMMVLQEDPVPPRRLVAQIPRDLENICLKCLEKNPSRRYESALDLANDLQRFVNGEPVNARPISRTERVKKWARRKPGLATTIAASVLLIGLTIGSLTIYTQQLASHSKQLADENERYKRLLDSNSRFADWIVTEHMIALQKFKGSTKQRQLLADKLRLHLDELEADAGNDHNFLLQLALAHEALADVVGNPNTNSLGNSSAALSGYQRALELHDRALAIEPQSAENIRGKAGCLLKMSDVAFQTDGIQKANELVNEANQVIDSLGNNQLQGKSALLPVMLLSRQFEIYKQQQRLDEAYRVLDKLREEAIPQLDQPDLQSEYQYHMINEANERGELLTLLGKHDEAVEQLERAHERARIRYLDQPDNALYQSVYVFAAIGYADSLIQLGRNKEAVELYESALKNRRELAEADPDDMISQRALAIALSRVSDGYIQVRDYEKALELQGQSVTIMRMLAEKDQLNIGHRRDLAKQLTDLSACHMNLQKNQTDSDGIEAAVAHNLQHFAKSRELLDEAIRVLDDLAELDPGHLGDQTDLAHIYYSLGVNLFSVMLLEMDEVPISSENQKYQQALRYLDNSLATYDGIAKVAPLNQLQTNSREGVVAMKKQFAIAVQQLAETRQEDL